MTTTPPDKSSSTQQELDDLERKLQALEAHGLKRKPDSSVTDASKALGQVWAIVLEFVVPIIVGAALGIWLDKRYDTTPILLAIFLLLGMGAGFTSLYRRANGYHPWRIGYKKADTNPE